jgi:hypothetical protein
MTCVVVRAPKMTGPSSDDLIFFSLWLQSLLITVKYIAIADLSTLHNSLLDTQLSSHGNKITTQKLALQITLNITNKIFKSHFKSSQADLLYSSVLLVPIRASS